MKAALVSCLTALCLVARTAECADAHVTVDVSHPGPEIPSSLYGIFFEEINHAGDGGIYAELLQNRSFEETVPVEGTALVNGICRAVESACYACGRTNRWTVRWPFTTPWPSWNLEVAGGRAGLSLDTNGPVHPANVNHLRVTVGQCDPDDTIRLINEGYWGVPVRKGERYELSLLARAERGFDGVLDAGLLSADGRVIARQQIGGVSVGDWAKLTCVLKPDATDSKARFFLQPRSEGVLHLDLVSLFPAKIRGNRANGLRPDLVKLLAGLKPAFMRFPGGCFVEGATLPNRYRWKETIGDIRGRPGHWCLWGYRSTDGLGFHEYLQLCEDIGTQGMYVINVGVACEPRNGDFAPDAEIQPFLQDALDAIEYAIGPTTSRWGALRASYGHPRPFPLKYIEIGNENYGPIYERRLQLFHAALKRAYPQLVYISDTLLAGGPPRSAAGPIELVDEHYYVLPDWFFNQHTRYDRVPRDRGYGVYVGEYACNQGVGAGNFLAALSEAAFMMGMERNSDVVKLCSYAPLFFNVNRLDWPVNLIGYDGSRSFGRSSYQVQKMFAEHRPDVNLATTCEAEAPPLAGPQFRGGVGLGTWNTQAEYKDIRIEHDGQPVYSSAFADGMGNWKPAFGDWQVVEGALRQSAEGERKLVLLPGFSGEAYTLTLKARKLGGAEGFLILFAAADRDNYHQLNLGGWGNGAHGFERIRNGQQAVQVDQPGGRVETGRWHDIRLEVGRERVEAFLDGRKLLQLDARPSPRFFAIAGLDRKHGEVVLKLLNASERSVNAQVDFRGVRKIAAKGRVIFITGNPEDENTLDQPLRLDPREHSDSGFGPAFERRLAPWTFEIVRLKAKP